MPAPVPPTGTPVVLPPRTRGRTVLLSVGVLAVSVVAGLIGALILWAFGRLDLDLSSSDGLSAAAGALAVAGVVAVGLWAVGVVRLVRRLFPAGARVDTGVLVVAAGAGATLVALVGLGLALPVVVKVLLLLLPQVLMAAVLHARDAGLRRTAATAAVTTAARQARGRGRR
ncbi:MAG TPA: hypothetical protein VGC57_10505 [Cellulomonas sp.]